MSVKALLRDYPDRSVIDSLYEGQTYGEVPEDDSDITEEERESNDRFYNNNQTWDTPGYKWKTQVEFSPAEDCLTNTQTYISMFLLGIRQLVEHLL